MKLKPAFLDLSSAAECVSITEDELISMVKRGDFPQPRQVSAKKISWLTSDVEDWALKRPRSRPKFENSNGRVFHLYRHFDDKGELLYVGVSLSALNRLMGHQQNSHWFWDIAKVEVSKFETRQASLDAETEAIKSEKPLHNIIHNMREIES